MVNNFFVRHWTSTRERRDSSRWTEREATVDDREHRMILDHSMRLRASFFFALRESFSMGLRGKRSNQIFLAASITDWRTPIIAVAEDAIAALRGDSR
jgi:hypothetical protein